MLTGSLSEGRSLRAPGRVWRQRRRASVCAGSGSFSTHLPLDSSHPRGPRGAAGTARSPAGPGAGGRGLVARGQVRSPAQSEQEGASW